MNQITKEEFLNNLLPDDLGMSYLMAFTIRDYGIEFENGHKEAVIPCNCGHQECRGWILVPMLDEGENY